MRKIDVKELKSIIKMLCIQSCTVLNDEIIESFKVNVVKETQETAKMILNQLIINSEIAEKKSKPICQDTGYTVIFLEIGQEIFWEGGLLKDAIYDGVREAYAEGYLRKSILKDVLFNPVNTGDNTPPIIHYDIVAGDMVKIIVLPKGGGSENMSRLKMMSPSDSISDIKKFVIDTVRNAGANACPPMIIGIGVGGTFDYVTFLAKKALLRNLGQRNNKLEIAEIEKDLIEELNKTNIGPGGLGGITTVLDVFIESYPRHIASLPVAVNIQCNAARKKEYII